MFFCRCLVETTKPETIIIKRIPFLFLKKFISQFLFFNFLLSVYTIHSLSQHSSHRDTYKKTLLIFLSSCPSQFTLPCWSAEQRIQDSELRGPHLVPGSAADCWVTWPKSLFWKKQVKQCLHTVIMCVSIYGTLCAYYYYCQLCLGVRDCTSNGGHGTKTSSTAFGAMVKKESSKVQLEYLFILVTSRGMEMLNHLPRSHG